MDATAYDAVFRNLVDQLEDADLPGVEAVRAVARDRPLRSVVARTRDATLFARYIAERAGVGVRVVEGCALGVRDLLDAVRESGVLAVVGSDDLAAHVALGLDRWPLKTVVCFSEAAAATGALSLTDRGRRRILDLAGVPDVDVGRGARAVADVLEAIAEWALVGHGVAWRQFTIDRLAANLERDAGDDDADAADDDGRASDDGVECVS